MQVFEALEGDLGTLAASRTKRGKLRRREQLRRADLLWRTVVVPDAEAPRRLLRRYRDGLAALLTDARALVERAVAATFDHDADRFTRLVQPSSELGAMPGALESQLGALRDEAPGTGDEPPEHEDVAAEGGAPAPENGEATSGDDEAPSGGGEQP
jgi:hypothetical protein